VRLRDCAAPPVAGAGVEEAAELVVAVVAVGVLVDELVVLEELPQPAKTNRLTASASTIDIE
jgi:hypothetical protein